MRIYYKNPRFLTGNIYMSTTQFNYSEGTYDILVAAGVLTKEDYDNAMNLIAASLTVGGAYPYVYVTSVFDDLSGTNDFHYCINSIGKIALISATKLYMHYPKSLYDGSNFVNNVVKGVFNESYDYGYGHMSKKDTNGFELSIDVDQMTLKFIGFNIVVDTINHIIALDKPIPKASLTADTLKKVNSLIHVMFNKRRYMLVEVSDFYELLQV